jgi:hypothetical protein
VVGGCRPETRFSSENTSPAPRAKTVRTGPCDPCFELKKMSGGIQSHSNFNQQQREDSQSNQQQREGSKLAS